MPDSPATAVADVKPASHAREILRLAVPAFGALIAEPLFLLADSAIVGHLGVSQLAGVGLASAVSLHGDHLDLRRPCSVPRRPGHPSGQAAVG